MTDGHDAIDELLAGYVLRSLSGADATEADRLLAEHVPACAACKQTLDAFQSVVGELGLEPAPVEPPETLLPRLRRELEPRARRWNQGRLVAVAASVLLIVGLGGVALTQAFDGSDSALVPADLMSALDFATRADARSEDIGPATEVSAPGVEEFYLYSTDCPQPPSGWVYRVWLVSATESRYVTYFVPNAQGQFVVRIAADPSAWDRVLVTVEPEGAEPSAPGEPAWAAAG